MRLAWTPLVFGILSVISIAKYSAAEYMDPLEDVYESFAFAALFLLFVQYVCPGKASREQYFYNLESTKRNGQVVPGGSLKWFNVSHIPPFPHGSLTKSPASLGPHLPVFCRSSDFLAPDGNQHGQKLQL